MRDAPLSSKTKVCPTCGADTSHLYGEGPCPNCVRGAGDYVHSINTYALAGQIVNDDCLNLDVLHRALGDAWRAGWNARVTVETTAPLISMDHGGVGQVGCEREDGTLNVHGVNETCEVCKDSK